MLPDAFTKQYLRQLEVLRLRARRKFLGTRQGAHRSLKRGHGIEFFDYRKYELGDNPRHIDWSLYARSERLYIKRFQEEQDISLLLVLDATASMFTPASSKKWEYAVNVALSLAYVAFYQQDRVSLAVPGSCMTPYLRGSHALQALARKVTGIEPSNAHNFSHDLRRAAASVKQPGMAVYISDFLMPLSEIEKLVRIILGRNLDTTFIQVLSAEEKKPLSNYSDVLLVDSETDSQIDISLTPEVRSSYEQLFKKHQEQLINFFRNRRLTFISVDTSEALDAFMSQSLSAIGIVQ
ncbi:MAG: DUF58 domain-containing protein [Bdellovibrionales bacterium]|nr:DUF58 domain-containing protein [Bdellovibrionales bacterium]